MAMVFSAWCLLGVMTAIGGGTIRDILVSEVPEVLKSGFYATASIVGAVVYFFIYQAAGISK